MAVKETRRVSENIKVKIAGFFGQILFYLNSKIMTLRTLITPMRLIIITFLPFYILSSAACIRF